MKKIQDIAAFVFIGAATVLSIVSILGIWDVFDRDVVSKSFETIGLLAVVAAVIVAAGKFIEPKSVEGGLEVVDVPSPAFKSTRRITVAVLIVSAALLAFLGVLAIWDVVADKQTLYKSFGSLAVLVFTSFIVIMTCLGREGIKIMGSRNGKGMSLGAIVLLILGSFLFLNFFRFFF